MTAPNSDSFEESAEELDSELIDEVPGDSLRHRWEAHQRDLLTHPMDFSVDSLVRLVENDELDLNPSYERRDRWDIKRKSRLVESFLLNIPVPSIYLNEDHYGLYSVIDGKQRIGALVGFVRGEYELTGLNVLTDANGCNFSDLDTSMQRALLARGTVRAVILNKLSDPEMKYEVFARINTGGVPLNAQELRNAAFPGAFNSLTRELSEIPRFQQALDHNPAIWREMRDVELVLRYFTLTDQFFQPQGSMSHALSRTLQRRNESTLEELRRDHEDFTQAVEKCHSAFGKMIYRHWRPEAETTPQQISVAVYDAQMLAVRDFDIATISANSEYIQERLKDLFTDLQFASALRMGNATRHSLEIRVGAVRRILEDAVGSDAQD